MEYELKGLDGDVIASSSSKDAILDVLRFWMDTYDDGDWDLNISRVEGV